MKVLKILVLVFCLILVSQASAINLISNGSFELASVDPGGGFITLGAGSTAITGWLVTGHSIDYIGGSWQAADGSRSIDLSGNQPGGLQLSQSLATTVGTQYSLSFAMAGNPVSGLIVKTLQLGITGLSPIDFTFDITGKSRTNMGWITHTVLFTATSTNTMFDFSAGANTAAWGPALDNVSLHVIPEPGTVMLLGFGLVGLGIYGRRRQKKML